MHGVVICAILVADEISMEGYFSPPVSKLNRRTQRKACLRAVLNKNVFGSLNYLINGGHQSTSFLKDQKSQLINLDYTGNVFCQLKIPAYSGEDF